MLLRWIAELFEDKRVSPMLYVNLREVPIGLLLRRSGEHYHYDAKGNRITAPMRPGKKPARISPGSFRLYVLEDERVRRGA